jgi:hypothetical protein
MDEQTKHLVASILTIGVLISDSVLLSQHAGIVAPGGRETHAVETYEKVLSHLEASPSSKGQ